MHLIEVVASMGAINPEITQNMTINIECLRKHWAENGNQILEEFKEKWEILLTGGADRK